MKLHELSPVAGSVKEKASARAEVTVLVTERPQARDTRVRRLVPAAE